MKKVRVEKKLELLLFVFFFLIYIPFSSSQIQDHSVNAEALTNHANYQVWSHGNDSSSDVIQPRLRSIPRNKRDYAKPGHYKIAVSLNKSQLNPGDSFQAGAYITGYGKIGGSKVAIFSSNTEIFDTSSEVLTDLYQVQDSLKYGGQSSKFSTVNCIINLSGGIKFGRKDSTFDDNYFDANLDTNNLTVITELQVENAPVTLNIKLKDNIEPGTYKINFYFTYFNGEQWVGSSQTTEFKVNNFVERNNVLLSLTGLFVAVISILPLFVTGLKKVAGKLKQLYPKRSLVPLIEKNSYIKKEISANKKADSKNTNTKR